MTLPDIEPFNGLDDAEFAVLTFMHYWSGELRAAQWYGDLEFSERDLDRWPATPRPSSPRTSKMLTAA
jgi:hypothetical protein